MEATQETIMTLPKELGQVTVVIVGSLNHLLGPELRESSEAVTGHDSGKLRHGKQSSAPSNVTAHVS